MADRVSEMFAFLSTDPITGDEGLCAFLSPDMGVMMPMVGADPRRVDALRLQAQAIATQTGQPIEIVRFTVRETVDTITP